MGMRKVNKEIKGVVYQNIYRAICNVGIKDLTFGLRLKSDIDAKTYSFIFI
jgi:hypothetical protein